MKFKNNLTEKLKKRAVKAIAAGLAISIFLPTLTGCDSIKEILPIDDIIKEIFPSEKLPPFETSEIRPMEEIEENGITADDVLAIYDEFVLDMVRAHYSGRDFQDALIGDVSEISSLFLELSTEYTIASDWDNLDNYFYAYKDYFYLEQEYSPWNYWIDRPGGSFYQEEPIIENVYPISIRSKIRLLDQEDEYFAHRLGVSKTAMEDFFKAYNLEAYEMTYEIAQTTNIPYEAEALVGEFVYPKLSITRESIMNANEQQLWALYNMITSLKSINFYGENPVENKIYDIKIK